MSDLSVLIEERERVRNKERSLTEEIKASRKKEADLKKSNRSDKKEANVTYESYQKLQNQNKRLRGIILTLHKLDGKTYAQAGEVLGVSATRARQIIAQEIRVLMKSRNEDT
ncbi:MAG: DNA-directed RNA polymerase specialized sigma24 family protein [Cycloclasticus pugetii]|jgi:DNA-directed RNA polymerase specialized sigma24 family protein